jgi:hypothetical protein
MDGMLFYFRSLLLVAYHLVNLQLNVTTLPETPPLTMQAVSHSPTRMQPYAHIYVDAVRTCVPQYRHRHLN